MTLFEQYGIKEVADVTLYSIHKKEDGSGNLYYVPALYLDTLKVSTTEKTAENTWAQGGIGNSRLINWDYGKTINVNLEDALCTPASLGLCWNGILSAGWKNGKLEFNSETDNSVTKISRMEKARATRYDPQKGTVSNLLPKIKADMIDDYFSLLKISSVVDGTDVRGFGSVKNHTYRWKMAIESVVKSIAVVPDRFFDITGKSYPIDWNRKVSVHSLPDYENYKDAIIYKINNRGKFVVPPLAKIIYDAAMEGQGTIKTLNFSYNEAITEENYKPSYSTLGELIKYANGKELNSTDATPAQYRFKVYEGDIIEAGTYDNQNNFVSAEQYYFPMRGLSIDVAPSVGYETYKGGEPGAITIKTYNEISKNTEITVAKTGSEKVNDNEVYYDLSNKVWQLKIDGSLYTLQKVNSKEDIENTGFYETDTDSTWFKAVVTDDTTNLTTIPIPQYCSISEENYKANKEDLSALDVTFVITDKKFYVYDVNEQCYKVNTNSELYTKIKDSTLKELEEDIGESLTKYLWNHPVNMVKNDASYEYIEITNYSRAIEKCDYLAIIVDNNNNYIPLMGVAIGANDDIGLSVSENFGSVEPEGKRNVIWFDPCPMVDVSQFKGIDMWLRFQSINEMIYFLITKYEDDIVSIKAATIESPEDWAVNKKTTTVRDNTGLEAEKVEGKLWAYVNPRTMTPYDDDYWFHQGEPYYIKSLTLAPSGKKISGKRITVTADQWPGMYMMVGETWIRNRDTGEDMRMQIKIPLCKVRSDHTLTLEAEGEPTTFNMALEVAQPQSGELMEITAYEVRTRMVEGEDGKFYAVDGSSEVVIE